MLNIAVVLLVGLTVPIALVLVAIAIDAGVLLWMLVRVWHDEWSPRLHDAVVDHVIAPLAHVAHVRYHHGHRA
jgi:hypothetical protein